MSSSNVSLILSELQATKAEVLSLKSQMSSLQSLLSSKLSVAASSAGGETPAKGKKAKKEKKERDPDAEPRAPTAWRLFTERVGTLLKTEGYSGKDLAVGNLQFCKTLKTENEDLSSWVDADILARRAAWTAPEPKTKEEKASAAASVVSGDAELEEETSSKPAKKPRKSAWEGLSEEERKAKVAKMQAGRAAKKAEKEGAKEDAPASPKASAAKSESSPPPAKTAAVPSAKAVAPPSAPAESAPADEFRPVMLKSKRYFVNLASGHAYLRNEDGSQGDWAGIFHNPAKAGEPQNPDAKTPKAPWIDASVPEPGAEGEEEEELTFGDDE
jgi:hypothetical protein